MPSVVIGLPVMRGQLEPECFHSIMSARNVLYQAGIPNNVLTNECSLISASRNNLCEGFLNQTSADYLMFIDSDIQFPRYGIGRLINRNVDVIGGVYYHKDATAYPTVYNLAPEDNRYRLCVNFPLDKPFEVDGIGTGFLLIHRRVLERFSKGVCNSVGTPFGLGKAPDGTEEGEDLAFCRRVKVLGFKIWADPTIPLGHIGKKAYTREHFETAAEFSEWREKTETYSNDIEGWMTKGELNWLYTTAKDMKSIIEVGSWKGRSTHALLSGCKGKVIAIDTFAGSKGEEHEHAEAKEHDITQDFLANVGQFQNLEVWKMDSLSAVKRVKDKSVDMVFIDGEHTYEAVKADIEAWLPKAKRILCGHDYQWHGVQEAVTEKFGEPNTAETIWVKKIDSVKTVGPLDAAKIFMAK